MAHGRQRERPDPTQTTGLQGLPCWPLLAHPYSVGMHAADATQSQADADLATALRECVAHVAAGRFDGGANRSFARVSALASLGGGERPPQRLARIMADGLVRRLIGSFTGRGISGALMDSSGYYFDRRCVRAARCSFFKLLPALRVAFVTINRAILDAMENEKFVHVIDLSGPAAHPWQWVKLMRALHSRPGGAPQLRITVVHDDGDFLAQTAALLRREAEALDMAFSFHPVLGQLETLELGNLHHTLAIRSGDARAFSCALQMHRLLAVDDTQQVASMAPLPQLAAPSCCPYPPGVAGDVASYSTEVVKTNVLDPSPTTPLSPSAAQASPSAVSSPHPQRAAVVPPLAGFLSAVRAVSPKVVCVMEQDAGDNVPDLAARFEEALHHYAAVFEALDDAARAAGEAREEERAAVERVLLWEEVKDVVARDGSERWERHERLHQWATRMAGAGFAGVPLSYVAQMEADAVLRRCGLRGYETRGVEGGCLLLCRSGWPLYSISAWRPWRPYPRLSVWEWEQAATARAGADGIDMDGMAAATACSS